jgi:hypothetical protein
VAAKMDRHELFMSECGTSWIAGCATSIAPTFRFDYCGTKIPLGRFDRFRIVGIRGNNAREVAYRRIQAAGNQHCIRDAHLTARRS